MGAARALCGPEARRYPAGVNAERIEPQPPGVEGLHRDDAARVAALPDAVRAHANESHWWNHASFMLPLIGCVGLTVPGLAFGWAEAIGFGLFLGVVLVLQLPVVWFTWRGTATAIVLTERGALALHRGEVRREVRWSDLERIERVETFGNVRWKLVEHGGEHVSIEGEIADIPALIACAGELSGVEPDGG